ncbi:MAG: acetyl-CoA carboxylase biotin carboxyl carrier protein [Phenylobacterium sp.]
MAGAPKPPTDQIDTRLVRKLADILTETNLSEIEVEHDGLKIRVAKTLTAAPMPIMAQAHSAPALAPAAPVAAAAAPAAVDSAPARAAGDLVKSPMVGSVYLQPQPGADPFVKIGDTVTAGQTLMIIEAMKTMNPIPATKGGKLVEILVEDGQPVEFGEPLAVIE